MPARSAPLRKLNEFQYYSHRLRKTDKQLEPCISATVFLPFRILQCNDLLGCSQYCNRHLPIVRHAFSNSVNNNFQPQIAESDRETVVNNTIVNSRNTKPSFRGALVHRYLSVSFPRTSFLIQLIQRLIPDACHWQVSYKV